MARLQAVRTSYDYESVALYDARGRLRLELGQAHGTNPHLDRLVSEALKARSSRFSDLYRDDDRLGHVHLDFVMPLTFKDQGRQAIGGVVVLRVDPTHYLYSLIQRWPYQSRSGETLIVRREGDGVLFLSELRNRPGSALALRMPLTTLKLPAAQAVHGKTGAFEGTDYGGVPVLAVLRPIRDTPWYMIAKVDREEILAPTRQVQLVSAVITLVAILIAGLLVGLAWRQQMRNFALRQRVQEAEKQALVKHFEYLSRNANDLILLADENLHIVEINDRAFTLIGYQPAEMIGQPLIRFRTASAREMAASDYARLQNEGHARYETTLSHRNGGELPIEVSATRVEAEGRYYYQLVVRDITERKRHEEQLLVARDFYVRILDTMPNPVWRVGVDSKCNYVNQAWLKFTGRALEQELGEGWAEVLHPDDRQRTFDVYLGAFHARETFRTEYRVRHHSGEFRWFAVNGEPIHDANGEFMGYIGSCYDIHDSRLYEKKLSTLASQLAEQKTHLETVLATTPEHVYLHDRDGRYLVASDAALTALGMERERVIGHTWQEIGMQESVLRPFTEQREKVLREKTPVTGQVSYLMVRGMRDYDYTINPVFGADGQVIATVTTATDVTERLRAERRVDRLSRMYATLSQCNQAIVRIRDRTELFREICRIIVHNSRFRFAWIGWLDRNWNEMTPIAFNDEAGEYLADLRISLEEGKAGRHYPAGKAVLEGRHVIANDFLNNPKAGAWNQRAIRAGIAATASFPIRQQGEIVGTLNVCSAEPDYFNDDLVNLLDEMASDIGFALDNYQQAEALRQSESTLRLFFDLPFTGMAVTSPRDKRWVQVNQALCDMLGYPREELVKRSWAEITHPNDLVEDVANFERVMRSEIDGYKMDKRFIRKDGQVVYASIDVKCIRDRKGDVDFFVATISDITGRIQAETFRRAEEDRYLRQRNALIGLSTSPALTTDDLLEAFRRITEVNAATLGVARVSIWRFNADRNAIHCADLYEQEAGRHSAGTELAAADYPSYFRALEQKDVVAADDAHHDPNTREFSETYLQPLGISSMLDAPIHLGNRLEGVLCCEHVGPPRQWTSDEKNFAIAITNLVSLTIEGWERKRNEEKLAAATEQFQGLVEQSIAGIFIIADGRYAYVNPRLAEILGYPSGELVGRDAADTIEESDRPGFRANIALCLSGAAESQLMSYVCRRPDGSRVDVGAHINRATHAGRPAVIGVVQDISDKKRSDEKIQEYIHRLERGMLSTIKAVSVMSELRDPYTYGHEQRVGDLAGAIAKEMGLDADVTKGLQIAGYVHDIGKIVVPAEILAKPTKLTKAEFELIKAHPQQGYEVLKEIDFPWPVAQVALQHHERLDGSGYPQGLKADQIVIEARILAVADVVEAMAAHRPYRPSRGIEDALDEVVRNRGTKYDPAAVDACVRLFHERGYTLKSVL
jgi:PAS domain S-box-containing protein